MSGESPREEKVEVDVGAGVVGRAYQTEDDGDTVTPMLDRHRSRQQLIAR
jgi:hypothetical protein